LGKSFSDGTAASRALISLGSYVQRMHPDVEVRISDGNIESQENIITAVTQGGSWDLVGISTHATLSYENCLQVAKVACDQGSAVLLGGVHVNAVGPERVVLARGYDTCRGRGEECLEAYVRYLKGKLKKSDIPNLVWKNWEGKVIANDIVLTKTHIDCSENILDMLDFSVYQKNFQRVFLLDVQPWIGHTHEGCAWRDKSHGGCRFCTLTMPHRLISPSIFWRELCSIARLFPDKPLWFKDTGDCISGDWDFVRHLIHDRPQDVPSYCLECYVHPGELRSMEQVKLLQDLRVKRVFVGFESGDNRMLKSMRKGSSEKLHKNCVQLLAKGEIEFVAIFVLGLRGETVESLEKTLAFAQYIKAVAGDLAMTISATPVLPLPGSSLWTEILRARPEYGLTDSPDVQRARRDWIHLACPELGENSTSAMRILEEYAQKVNQLSSRVHRYS